MSHVEVPAEVLGRLLAAAWLQGLQDRPTIAPTDPATTVRLDTPDRPPVVRLQAPRQRGKGDYA